jgi:hypothetical protein
VSELLPLPENPTLAEAKAWLRVRAPEGERCPCCTRFVKVYRRPMLARQAVMLIKALQQKEFAWFHISELSGHFSGDLAKLRHWGLIEGAERGTWRVTPLGAAFALGRARVPSHFDIYDRRFQGLWGDLVGIRDVLEKRFDYDELMSTPGSQMPELEPEPEEEEEAADDVH